MFSALIVHRPARPCLPPRVASALQQSARSLFPEGQDRIPAPDPNWQPPLVDAPVIEEASAVIPAYVRYLGPITAERLSVRIAVMLASCSYVEDLEPPAQDMVLDMRRWALSPFPERAVAEAIDQWLASLGRRPTGAEIVGRCRSLVGKGQTELGCLRHLVDPREQERARARRDAEAAEQRRDEERQTFLAANPNWSVRDRLPAAQTLAQPSTAEARSRPVKLLPPEAGCLPPLDSPIAQYWLRAMGAERGDVAGIQSRPTETMPDEISDNSAAIGAHAQQIAAWVIGGQRRRPNEHRRSERRR